MRIWQLARSSSIALALLAGPSTAQNCAQTSVGLTPIDDLGTGTYMGFQGGLYPLGSNTRPAAHEAAGLAEVALVVPRDAAGNPDPAGRIVFLSIGMSNATQEFSRFVQLASVDPLRDPAVLAVDGAQGGQTAAAIDDPTAPFWNVVFQRLTLKGVTPAQVQVIWLKEANASPTDPFPLHAQTLASQYVTILQILRDFFPNARLCYLASRIYAGYATTALNPEPYAYEQGFACKWVIEDQIGGDPALNYDPGAGPVEAPWLAWGTYNWADGLVPRGDGLTWLCSDYQPDGTHPSTTGADKVASILLGFVQTDPNASLWYLGPPPSGPGTPLCFGDGSGTNCPCTNFGAPGRGCENSAATGGAELSGTGVPALNTVVLHGAGFPPAGAPTVIVIRGTALASPPPVFGDGIRCPAAPLVRMNATSASAGASTHPINHGAGPGTFHYQLWYRNTPAGFCTAAAHNLSNGYAITFP